MGSRDPGEARAAPNGLSTDGAGIGDPGVSRRRPRTGSLLVLAVLGTAAEEAIADAGAEQLQRQGRHRRRETARLLRRLPPKLSISGDDSLGERVQRALPEAKVVKAFNTIGNPYFVDPSFAEGEPTMLIAGNGDAPSAPSPTSCWSTQAAARGRSAPVAP